MSLLRNLFQPFREASNHGFGNILIVTGVAAVGLFVGSEIIKRGARSTANLKEEIRDRQARLGADKLFAAAGFMISNNLVICSEKGTSAAGAKCRWKRSRAFNSPDKFGLANPSFASGRLAFPISGDSSYFTSTQNFNFIEGRLTFDLIESNANQDLERFLGDRSAALEKIDRDRAFVEVGVELKYKSRNSIEEAKTFSYFRRPVANISTSVIADAICSASCKSAVSVNPASSCRGKQILPAGSIVNINVRTTNHGPGVLYDLKLKKKLCKFKGPNTGCETKGYVQVQIPREGLGIGESQSWTDQEECAVFTETIKSDHNGTVSQHLTDVGRIEYILDTADQNANMEPYRMNYKLNQVGDNLPGIKHTIYVDPPH